MHEIFIILFYFELEIIDCRLHNRQNLLLNIAICTIDAAVTRLVVWFYYWGHFIVLLLRNLVGQI